MSVEKFEQYKIHASVVTEVGLYSLKALITVNAGAILALLTIFPQMTDNGFYRVSFDRLQDALVCYLVGIGLVFLSMLLTIISAQLSCSGKPNGWVQVTITIFPSVLSFLAFGVGGYFALDAIEQIVHTVG